MTTKNGDKPSGPLIEVNWLESSLRQPNVKIFDVRWKLGDPEDGRQRYLAGHIPTAGFLNIDYDLSAPAGPHGGSRPLADPEILAATLRRSGVNGDDTVVVYDETTGQAAARAWWLLRHIGLEHVSVLNGGFGAWSAAGGSLVAGTDDEDRAFAVAPGDFRAEVRAGQLRHVDDIRGWVEARPADQLLVDARGAAAYLGEMEPPAGGHIPGALSLPAGDTLSKDGKMRSPAELRAHFGQLAAAEHVTVYCGSGVSACCNILAMNVAGIDTARLYPGSWSDWSSYRDHPAARGPDKG
jgi:thiosulfate/3-mercaptopyruvate sulfurtransferase